jgi:hypothetical protein
MVSVTCRREMRATSGASTKRVPESVLTTMPSKMCSRALSWTRWTVPMVTPSEVTTGTPRGRAW